MKTLNKVISCIVKNKSFNQCKLSDYEMIKESKGKNFCEELRKSLPKDSSSNSDCSKWQSEVADKSSNDRNRMYR